jgi:hypothetical protein
MKQTKLSKQRHWTMGGNKILEHTAGTHVGVLLSADLRNLERTEQACQKLKCIFMSLNNTGLHPNGMNPLTSYKLYEAVCLSSALYGCELWSSLSMQEMEMLEKHIDSV